MKKESLITAEKGTSWREIDAVIEAHHARTRLVIRFRAWQM
jgi:hypothetical protein